MHIERHETARTRIARRTEGTGRSSDERVRRGHRRTAASALSHLLLASCWLFASAFIAHAAVDVTLVGPEPFVRQRDPVHAMDFPAIPGAGVVRVLNGKPDGTERVAGAKITINGVRVLGPDEITRDVYEHHAPVSLSEHNLLVVEIESAPGAFLTVEIKQSVDSVAAQVVTPAGGTLEVTDTSSPLFGTRLTIPPEALNEPRVVLIAEPSSDATLPGNFEPHFLVELAPSGLEFAHPASLAFPVSAEGLSTEELEENWGVFARDDNGVWQSLDPIRYDPNAQAIIADRITHFSLFAADKARYRMIPSPHVTVSSVRAPVVLIHGFRVIGSGPSVIPEFCGKGGPDTFGNLPALLADDGLDVYAISYDSGKSIAASGRALGRLLASIVADHPSGLPANVIAHSEGGLVVRSWLESDAGRTSPPLVQGVVFAATPHHGANFALLAGLTLSDCRAAPQMRPCSGFLEGGVFSGGLNDVARIAGAPDLPGSSPDYLILSAELDRIVDLDSSSAIRCQDAASQYDFDVHEWLIPMGLPTLRCAAPYRDDPLASLPGQPVWSHSAACYDFVDPFYIDDDPDPSFELFGAPLSSLFPSNALRSVVDSSSHIGWLGVGIADIDSHLHPSWCLVCPFVNPGACTGCGVEPEFQDLNDNQVPAGWELTVVGNGGIAEGRLYASEFDGRALLTRPMDLPAGTTRVVLEYDANIGYSYWGMRNHAELIDSSGTRFQVSDGMAAYNYGSVNRLNVIVISPAGDVVMEYVRDYPLTYTDYHYTATFEDGAIRYQSELFDEAVNVPGLTLDDIVDVRFWVKCNSGTTAWLDNLRVEPVVQ